MNNGKTRIGIIGCGNIAGPYAQDLVKYSNIELVGVADIDPARAEKLASQYDCRAFPTVYALLNDPGIELVVNLTIFDAHKAVTLQCFNAGKHVYSEKPLALTYADAQELLARAREKNLRLGCSPMTFMGEAQQTAWKWIREGRLGNVRVAFAAAHNGRIETWHADPKPFYEVGPLFDVGVYPLTLLTTIFGPARRVWAQGQLVAAERVTKDKVPFRVAMPDLYLVSLEMASCPLVQLSTSYYVSSKAKQAYAVECHGDLGSLNLSNWLSFGADVEYLPFDKEYERIPLVRPAEKGVRWGRGVVDMAEAIAEGRPHRATGEQAAHVVDILQASVESVRIGEPVQVCSEFTPPAPMDWAI